MIANLLSQPECQLVGVTSTALLASILAWLPMGFCLFMAWCNLRSIKEDEKDLDCGDESQRQGKPKKRRCKLHHLGLKLQILLCRLFGLNSQSLLLRSVTRGNLGQLGQQEGKSKNNLVCGWIGCSRRIQNLQPPKRVMYVIFGGFITRWRRGAHIFLANLAHPRRGRKPEFKLEHCPQLDGASC